MNTVFFPVLNRQVDGTTCLEIVLLADGEMNDRIFPCELAWNEISGRSACFASGVLILTQKKDDHKR